MRSINIKEVLISPNGNQVVVQIDTPGFIHIESLKEFCAGTKVIQIGEDFFTLAEAISWGCSWEDSNGISKEIWLRRLDAIPRQTNLDRCGRILSGRHSV